MVELVLLLFVAGGVFYCCWPYLRARDREVSGPPGELESLELFAKKHHGVLEAPRTMLGSRALDGTNVLCRIDDKRAWLEVRGLGDQGQGPWALTVSIEVDPDLELEIRRPSVFKRKGSGRHAPTLTNVEPVEDPRFEVRRAQDVTGELVDFVHGGERLSELLIRLLYEAGADAIVARRGLMTARVEGTNLLAELARETLGTLAEISRAYSRRKAGPAIGTMVERFLWLDGGAPRCPYCHVDIAEGEPGLVACGKCRTIHHGPCWTEHGRCTLLGCGGSSIAV